MDNSKLINNIHILAKRQGKKIGDVERKAGVSAGYMSRIAKNDSGKINPSIDFIVAVADELDVSLDDLINNDFGVTGDDAYMERFLERLIACTKQQKILWDKNEKFAGYETSISDGVTVRLERNSLNNADCSSADTYELFLVDKEDNELLHLTDDFVKTHMKRLYDMVIKSQNFVRLNPDVKNVLDLFMETTRLTNECKG